MNGGELSSDDVKRSMEALGCNVKELEFAARKIGQASPVAAEELEKLGVLAREKKSWYQWMLELPIASDFIEWLKYWRFLN